MDRYIVGSIWDRANRNGINDNFEYLFRQVGKVDEMTEQAQDALNEMTEQAQGALNEANRVNGENKDVQKQIDDLIINSGTSDAEVVQARGSHDLLKDRFEDIESKRADYEFSSNNSQPAKKGLFTNSYKVVRKISDDELEVYQKTNNHSYLRYLFRQNSGGTGYGVNYELLRVVRVEPMADVLVYKNVDSPSNGSVSNTFNFTDGQMHSVLIANTNNINRVEEVETVSGHNLRPYTIAPKSEVTYRVSLANGVNKMNVAFFTRSAVTQDEEVKIKMNGYTLRTINITKTLDSSMQKFEFEVPTVNTRGYEDLSFENVSDAEVYIMGINVYELKDYGGQDVNDFIAFHSSLHPFISNTGASDYAMMNDEIGSNFGSYHGGEKSISCFVLWRGTKRLDADYLTFSGRPVGQIQFPKEFKIRQVTELIGRARMNSVMDFNTDGTLQMDFGYEVKSGETPIPFRDFWTSLTCTNPNFDLLRMPKYMDFSSMSNGHKYFPSTEGYVIQEASSTGQEVHIRFTRFNNEFNGNGNSPPSSISKQAGYNKHYYAPIRNYSDASRPVAPDVLQFSKGLDFYVY